jgi:outer membrane protein assembly factor BamB
MFRQFSLVACAFVACGCLAGCDSANQKAAQNTADANKSPAVKTPADQTPADKANPPGTTPAPTPSDVALNGHPSGTSPAKSPDHAPATEVKTPVVKTPEVKTPEIKTPEVKTPETKTPEVKTPAVEPKHGAEPASTTEPAPAAVVGDPMDWPNWRGPEQNRVSREIGLIDHWDPETGENVLWKNDEAGGICSPIVMRGKVYLINRYKPGTRYEQEEVLCLNAADGKVVWRNRHNMYLSDVPAERIGWAACVGDPTTGRIYAYNTNTLLQCLDGETGKEIWSHSMSEEFGFLSVFGGRTNFPVVFEDLLIVSSVCTGWGDKAPPAHRFIAMDKNTGEFRWINGTTPLPEDTTYSMPTFKVLGGQTLMVFGSSDGSVWAFQPRTGKAVWNYKMSRRGMSVSPLIVGETVYMAQNEENLDNHSIGMLCAFHGVGSGNITSKATIWKLPDVKEGKSAPVMVGDKIYAADDVNNFYVVNAKTGKQLSKKKLLGVETRASPLVADGKIYICSTTGFHIFKPAGNKLTTVQELRLDRADEVTGSMAVSHGRIFLPTGARLYCLGVKDKKPEATPIPPPAEVATPVGNDDKPAQVQVVPVEALLAPDGKQQYSLRLFNDRGQMVSAAPAEFTLKGPGKIDKDGLYRAADSKEPAATIVSAKVGEAVGTARIRIVPPLPWKFDFQKVPLVANPKAKGELQGLAPVTWIGINYRHVLRDIDGRKLLVKLNTIPKGTRSQGWMGPDDMHDYTIQADVRVDTAHKDNPVIGMPDIGLIDSRYTMMLMGADQQLQVRYWPPQIATQFSETKPFKWKPDVWYRMKFRVAVEGEKATIQGKVWPREEKEPDAWTVETVDDQPNTHGSPGLAGDTSNHGEAYYDNIEVYSNTDPRSK